MTSDISTAPTEFQSAPTPEGGRCASRPVTCAHGEDVSIRSHPGGWEMHGPLAELRSITTVSIRSHPGGWEMRELAQRFDRLVRVSIRSHPGGWEMR